jgi:uncharacterized protein YjbI with pentapeptide repeats
MIAHPENIEADVIIRLRLAGGSLERARLRTQKPQSYLLLFNTNGRNMDASSSDLDWSAFAYADLSGSNFENSNLSVSRFYNTKFNEARFNHANLQGSRFQIDIWSPSIQGIEEDLERSNRMIRQVDFSHANMGWSQFLMQGSYGSSAPARLSEVNFSSANLRHSEFRSTYGPVVISNTNFEGANLENATLNDNIRYTASVNFSGTIFTNATLRGDFRDTNLAAAADLTGAKYHSWRTQLPFSHAVAQQRGMIRVD